MKLNFGSPSADDLRLLGWSVAIHNDYRIKGQSCTFWMFSKAFASEDGFTISLKGEGPSDVIALDYIRALVPGVTERTLNRIEIEKAFKRLG